MNKLELCYTLKHCTASEDTDPTLLHEVALYCKWSMYSTLLHEDVLHGKWGCELNFATRQWSTRQTTPYLWKQDTEYLSTNQWTLQVRTPSALTHTRTVSRCKWAIHQLCKHTSEQTLQVIRTTALQAHVQASAASKHKQQLCYTLRLRGWCYYALQIMLP